MGFQRDFKGISKGDIHIQVHVANTMVVVETPLAWACGSVCGSTVHPRKGNEKGVLCHQIQEAHGESEAQLLMLR